MEGAYQAYPLCRLDHMPKESRQRISKYSCTREKTVSMDILITSNYGRKIMKPANLTHGPPKRMRKWNQFTNEMEQIWMDIY